MSGDGVEVRAGVREDLPRVAELAAEHAAYERADPPAGDFAERLAEALFDRSPPWVSLLVAALPDGRLAGYATCAPEFATWQGLRYLHMDCLYLRAEHRGHGLGRRLFDAVAAEAGALRLTEIQWNTPLWNEDAMRFYERLGAVRRDKARYGLRLPR
ncbi:N-acetyltransferase family protein [Streptomyces cucumeris]|uniref:GNAT family N-acetyltransferase n=1 Tax=Streptomyces cucumeris TaxID=2962890 RepID=UPI003D722C5A